MADKKPRKMNISDEERERRRQNALELRAQGKLGGAQKGAGRPKKDRAQTAVAEKVKEDGDKIYKTLAYLLLNGSDAVRLKSALAMLEIEAKENDIQMKEAEKDYENKSRDDLLLMLKERFETLRESGVDIDGIIMGRAKEISASVINER